MCLLIILALLPDIDVIIYIIFKFSNMLPHRGMTHSLLFSFITAYILTIIFERYFDITKLKLFFIFLSSLLSHLALDFLMGAGPAIPLFAPFSYKGFLSSIQFVPCAYYSTSAKGLFQILFYPPAVIGYCLEFLIFTPIILGLKKNKSIFINVMLSIIFIFAITSTFWIYN